MILPPNQIWSAECEILARRGVELCRTLINAEEEPPTIALLTLQGILSKLESAHRRHLNTIDNPHDS